MKQRINLIDLVQSFKKLDYIGQIIFFNSLDDITKAMFTDALGKDKNNNTDDLIAPTIKVKISNPTNKTMYLTFDQNGILRPAGGTVKGFLGVGKTDSGLSLRNNIKQSDIISDIIKE